MAGVVPDPRATYPHDGEVLFVLGLSMFGMKGDAKPLCAAVVGKATRESQWDFKGRSVLAMFSDAGDALAAAMAMEDARQAVAYVRTVGGMWAMLVPLDIDGGKIAARRLTLKGVRARVKGGWLRNGSAEAGEKKAI